MGTETNRDRDDAPAPVDTGKYRRENALEKKSDTPVSERNAHLTEIADVAREII